MSGKALAAGADRMHNPRLAPCGSLNNTSLSPSRAEYNAFNDKPQATACPIAAAASGLSLNKKRLPPCLLKDLSILAQMSVNFSLVR